MKLQKSFSKNTPYLLFSLLKIRPYAGYLARVMGYELVGEEGPRWQLPDYKFFPRKLPESIKKGPEDPYNIPFKVDINSITSRVGFSYEKDGWHPFVQTLKEYADDATLRYKDSCLARLYNNYCPGNLQEVMLDHLKTPAPPFCDWPATNDFIRNVWTLGQPGVRHFLKLEGKTPQTSGWIFFGPHTQEYGEKEFQRLIDVYESIKYNGYESGLTNKDPVNGYFLQKGTDFKFVLLQGNHRVSALQALGYTSVDVVIRQGHPAVVNRAHLHKWTEAGGGIYSSYLAKKMFDALFDGSGLEKARRHGLSG